MGSEYIFLFILAYISNLFLALILHFLAFYRGTYSKADILVTKFFKLPKNIKEIVYFLLSPDYYSAASIKNNTLLKINKHYYGNFIEKSNLYNFIISLVFSISMFSLIEYLQLHLVFLVLFWSIRVVSRSFEIIIAFVRDVIDNNQKSSDIKSAERIKLAIFSYFEIIIIYAGIYFLLSDHTQNHNIDNLFFYFINSIGVSTLTNVGYFCYNEFIEKSTLYFFKMLQLFTSISLLYFALAKYISSKE